VLPSSAIGPTGAPAARPAVFLFYKVIFDWRACNVPFPITTPVGRAAILQDGPARWRFFVSG